MARIVLQNFHLQCRIFNRSMSLLVLLAFSLMYLIRMPVFLKDGVCLERETFMYMYTVYRIWRHIYLLPTLNYIQHVKEKLIQRVKENLRTKILRNWHISVQDSNQYTMVEKTIQISHHERISPATVIWTAIFHVGGRRASFNIADNMSRPPSPRQSKCYSELPSLPFS